jgi:type VI secretion system protein VasG
MAEIQRPQLYGKLDPTAYKALESAAIFAKLRGNPKVELAHWLNQILLGQDSDLHRILRYFEVNEGRLSADLVRVLDSLPRGATSQPTISSFLDETTRQAWVYATLLFREGSIRTGHLVVALLKTRELAYAFRELSEEVSKLRVDTLTDEFDAILAKSPEEGQRASDSSTLAGGTAPGEASAAVVPGASKMDALARFTVDLTERARKKEIDPIVGRDEEVRQLVDILMRRQCNNPVLVGEAGVGKTAVVEGFAHRLVAGDVPPPLAAVTLRLLDIGLLQAGASMKGEFEQRLRSVIDEVQQAARPIILFIDEVHTLIGAGGAAGTGDAANLLKPALARGTLRTIAATTWSEYRKHIEKDPALSRRFQQVFVAEPDEARAIRMLRSATAHLERHHRVQILDEAIESAVRLSVRFIPGRQLPDKAVRLLDTAAARVAVGLHAEPALLEDARRRVAALEIEREILQREASIGLDHAERLADLDRRLGVEREAVAALQARRDREKECVTRILTLRGKLRPDESPSETTGAPPAPGQVVPSPSGASEAPPDRGALLAELGSWQARLAELQGDAPLLFPSVDRGTVASVVAEWTGIPVGRMARQNVAEVLNLAEVLERRVIGQRHALEMVARRIQASRSGLGNPKRPVGVFLFVGPSGTGKTETALALAEALYGGEQNLVTINMSEFQERHTVSTLKGAPPGYVGYGEGGVLTEAVRRRPHCVLLLDEIEKAHPDVYKIFFQVFDKGAMDDAEGRSIDFRNAVIILTSNAAQDTIRNLCVDPQLKPAPEALESALLEPLTKVFPDALLNRLDVVPYYPIEAEILHRIVRVNLDRVAARLRENRQLPFTYDDGVVDLIARRCGELERGARIVESLVANTMLPDIGREFLARTLDGRRLERVHVLADGDRFAYEFDAGSRADPAESPAPSN